MDLKTTTREELAALLKEAEKAHTEYEKMLGGRDEDWPNWYADFILKKLQNAMKLTTRPVDNSYSETSKITEDSKIITGPLDDKHIPKAPSASAPANNKPAAEKVDPATTSMQVCPTCGHRNRFGILLCDNCGTNLATGQQSVAGTRDLREGEAPPANSAAPSKLDTGEAKAVRTAGTGRFDTSMTLRIEVEGGATPIILKPKSHDMILGRRDPTTGATPEVDLTPYAGYRMGVSRKHASLKLQDNQLNLWDLGSSNGTFINGTRLHPHRPYPIRDGDEIRLGQMVLRTFFQSSQSR